MENYVKNLTKISKKCCELSLLVLNLLQIFRNNQKIVIKPLHKKCTMMTSVIQKLFSLFPQPTMIGTVKRQQEISMEDS